MSDRRYDLHRTAEEWVKLVARARRLLADGETMTITAKSIGVAVSTLHKQLRKHKVSK
jgi:transcriptional regulator of acetoin/glycerol metabolism